MSIDQQKWKDYLKAKSVVEKMENLDALSKKADAYEKHKQKVLANHYKNIQQGGDAYLDKISKRRKELYHLRKEKNQKDKEDKKQLELARAERSRCSGNPFGMAIQRLKMESSDSQDSIIDSEGDIYCSTCPTDSECASVINFNKKEEIAPPPPKNIQHLFARRF